MVSASSTLVTIQSSYNNDLGHFPPKDYSTLNYWFTQIDTIIDNSEKHQELFINSYLLFEIKRVGLDPESSNFENEMWMWTRDKTFKKHIIWALEMFYIDLVRTQNTSYLAHVKFAIKHPIINLKLLIIDCCILSIKIIILLLFFGSCYAMFWGVAKCFELVFKFINALFGFV